MVCRRPSARRAPAGRTRTNLPVSAATASRVATPPRGCLPASPAHQAATPGRPNPSAGSARLGISRSKALVTAVSAWGARFRCRRAASAAAARQDGTRNPGRPCAWRAQLEVSRRLRAAPTAAGVRLGVILGQQHHSAPNARQDYTLPIKGQPCARRALRVRAPPLARQRVWGVRREASHRKGTRRAANSVALACTPSQMLRSALCAQQGHSQWQGLALVQRASGGHFQTRMRQARAPNAKKGLGRPRPWRLHVCRAGLGRSLRRWAQRATARVSYAPTEHSPVR